MMRWYRSILVFLLSFWLCLAPGHSSAQQTTRRLILKDGSYQIVSKYEIQGDRVHYYSTERAEWEDVPESLIDWDATNKYERDRAAGKMSPEVQALNKEMEAERQQEEALSPHVSPGLRLPPEGGVYALDTYLSEPELLPLEQNNGEVNKQVGRNVLRSAINPLSGSKRTIELAGPRAKIQVHAALPTLYIDLEPRDEQDENAAAESETRRAEANQGDAGKPAQLPWDRFLIVRVQVKGDKRIVAAIRTAVLGKSHPEEEAIPATAEQFGEGWVKLTPKDPLPPGEYALAETLGKQGMNSYVWDFGVHPDAPANLAVIKPEKTKSDSPARKPDSLENRN
jgi:hypothetical protein